MKRTRQVASRSEVGVKLCFTWLITKCNAELQNKTIVCVYFCVYIYWNNHLFQITFWAFNLKSNDVYYMKIVSSEYLYHLVSSQQIHLIIRQTDITLGVIITWQPNKRGLCYWSGQRFAFLILSICDSRVYMLLKKLSIYNLMTTNIHIFVYISGIIF